MDYSSMWAIVWLPLLAEKLENRRDWGSKQLRMYRDRLYDQEKEIAYLAQRKHPNPAEARCQRSHMMKECEIAL